MRTRGRRARSVGLALAVLLAASWALSVSEASAENQARGGGGGRGLDVGAECPLEVMFAPAAAGDKQATLFIPVGPAGSTMSVPLTGTAVAAAQ